MEHNKNPIEMASYNFFTVSYYFYNSGRDVTPDTVTRPSCCLNFKVVLNLLLKASILALEL